VTLTAQTGAIIGAITSGTTTRDGSANTPVASVATGIGSATNPLAPLAMGAATIAQLASVDSADLTFAAPWAVLLDQPALSVSRLFTLPMFFSRSGSTGVSGPAAQSETGE
jgi:hypothetical protein